MYVGLFAISLLFFPVRTLRVSPIQNSLALIGKAYNHTPIGTVLWDRGQPIGSISGDTIGHTGDTYIAFRGTDSLSDWFSDLDTDLVPFGHGRVSRGFLSVYQREYHLTEDGSPCVTPILWDLCISAYGAIRRVTHRTSIQREVAAAGRAMPQRGTTIWVSGHSLGGALATLAVTDIPSGDLSSEDIPDTVYSVRTVLLAFGSPKVGDSGFVGAFAKMGATRAYRIHMVDDVVPQIPLPCYRHVPAKVIGLLLSGDCPSEDIHWLHAIARYWEAIGTIEEAVGLGGPRS